MEVITHKIGGIVFQTKWNNWLPVLKAKTFDKFKIACPESVDVYHNFFKIEKDLINKSFLRDKIVNDISNFYYWSQNGFDSYLDLPSIVKTRSFKNLEGSNKLDIINTSNMVTIRNFARNIINVFYSSRFGGFVQRYQSYIPQHFVTANFRFIYSSLLPNFSAFLIHSSGIIRNGMAILFVAPDDGGKTTILKHFKDSCILNDDQIVLRDEQGIIMAHSTPLGKMTKAPCQARLGCIFLLEKASYFELRQLNPKFLLDYLWNEHQNYIYSLPKYLKVKVFEILSKVCYKTPIFRLKFSRDYLDLDAIDKAMGN